MYGWRLKRGKDQANQLTVAGKFKSPDTYYVNKEFTNLEFWRTFCLINVFGISQLVILRNICYELRKQISYRSKDFFWTNQIFFLSFEFKKKLISIHIQTSCSIPKSPKYICTQFHFFFSDVLKKWWKFGIGQGHSWFWKYYKELHWNGNHNKAVFKQNPLILHQL